MGQIYKPTPKDIEGQKTRGGCRTAAGCSCK